MALFKQFDRTPFVIKLADRFHTDSSQHFGFHALSDEGRTQGQTVDDRCQHPHLVAFHTVEPFVGTAQSAENVSTAYHDAYLYSQFVDFFDLSCVLGKAFLVDAVLLFTHQALAAEFQ